MANGIFEKQKLEELLQHNWGKFLDHLQMMRRVMEDVRDTTFKEIRQQDIPARQVKFSVTKLLVKENQKNNYALELWIEYTMPKDDGVVIGTNIYALTLDGSLSLDESFGTHFRPKTS